jgi:hypothetical protein
MACLFYRMDMPQNEAYENPNFSHEETNASWRLSKRQYYNGRS